MPLSLVGAQVRLVSFAQGEGQKLPGQPLPGKQQNLRQNYMFWGVLNPRQKARKNWQFIWWLLRLKGGAVGRPLKVFRKDFRKNIRKRIFSIPVPQQTAENRRFLNSSSPAFQFYFPSNSILFPQHWRHIGKVFCYILYFVFRIHRVLFDALNPQLVGFPCKFLPF
jgi:hypothetical protein